MRVPALARGTFSCSSVRAGWTLIVAPLTPRGVAARLPLVAAGQRWRAYQRSSFRSLEATAKRCISEVPSMMVKMRTIR